MEKSFEFLKLYKVDKNAPMGWQYIDVIEIGDENS